MTLYTAKKSGWWVLRDLLKRNEPFHNSHKTFRGEHTQNAMAVTGRMDTDDRNDMRAVNAQCPIDYVIFSYGTPIAYRSNDTWHVPATTYSPTTTQHQSKTRAACQQINDERLLSLCTTQSN